MLCLSPALQRGPQKPALCVVWQRLHCSHYHSQNLHRTIKLYSFHLFLKKTRLMQSCWVRACVCPSMYLPAIFEHLPDFDHCWQKVRDLDNTKLIKVIRKMSTWSEIRKTYLQSQSRKSLPAHPWTPKDPTWVARPREIRLCQCCGLLKHHGIAARDTMSCGLPQDTLVPQNPTMPWAEGLNSPWSKQLPHSSYYSKEREKHHISHPYHLWWSQHASWTIEDSCHITLMDHKEALILQESTGASVSEENSWKRHMCQGEKITKKNLWWRKRNRILSCKHFLKKGKGIPFLNQLQR